MADEAAQPLVIKTKKIKDDGHHGGAWKVAYADFVTAMMAFFLLLWLLNATTEEQKDGISNYFEPIGAVKGSSGSDGMFGGISVSDPGPIPEPGAKESLNLEDPSDEDLDSDARGEGEDVPEISSDVSEIDPVDEERLFNTAKRLLESALDELPPELKDLKDTVKVDVTEEGLRIQLLDHDRNPMFEPQSAALTPLAEQVILFISTVVARLPNRVSITGHTDATPFTKPDGSGKWKLSLDRSQSARRALVATGIDAGRFKTVLGKADTEPAFGTDPTAAQNRRVVIVLNRQVPDEAQSDNPLPPPITQ